MDRGTILKNLEWNRKAEDTTNAVIGCVQTVNQCGQSLQGWLDRKPDRRRVLRQLITGCATQKGRKAFQQLIDYTISVVKARKWVKKFWVGALPIRWETKGTLTEAQKAALNAGRAQRHNPPNTHRHQTD